MKIIKVNIIFMKFLYPKRDYRDIVKERKFPIIIRQQEKMNISINNK
jgi:hypothetical protein